jgi:hypothetical protein
MFRAEHWREGGTLARLTNGEPAEQGKKMPRSAGKIVRVSHRFLGNLTILTQRLAERLSGIEIGVRRFRGWVERYVCPTEWDKQLHPPA